MRNYIRSKPKNTHVGIPITSFKAPARSWRPIYSMAIAEAWPDPNPTTMPLVM